MRQGVFESGPVLGELHLHGIDQATLECPFDEARQLLEPECGDRALPAVPDEGRLLRLKAANGVAQIARDLGAIHLAAQHEHGQRLQHPRADEGIGVLGLDIV